MGDAQPLAASRFMMGDAEFCRSGSCGAIFLMGAAHTRVQVEFVLYAWALVLYSGFTPAPDGIMGGCVLFTPAISAKATNLVNAIPRG